MPGVTKGRFVIAFLVCCLGSFVLAQAQDEKSAANGSGTGTGNRDREKHHDGIAK